MQAFFTVIGLPNLGMSQMLTIALLGWASAFALAWISDAILGDGAFGVVLNTSILIVGAIIALIVWKQFGHGPMANQTQLLAMIATGGGVAMLVVCGVLRRWI